MLMQSRRHTTKDLQIWSELSKADAIHGERLNAKIEKAKKVILSFAQSPCFVSVSWGKDSIVVAHLAFTVDPAIELGYLRITATVAENPDNEVTRDKYLSITKQRYREAVGRTTVQHDFRQLNKVIGLSRTVNGVRKDESSERLLSRMVHGESTANTCRPIIDWSTADVMGYLARFDLPVHPAYAMLGGGRYDRNWIRVATLGGERGTGMDRAAWESEYYGDIIRRSQCTSK